MNKYCCDCANLNESKAKGEGIYYCKKSGTYVNACASSCSSFKENYGVSAYKKQELYDLGKKALQFKDQTLNESIIIFLFLIILGIIGKFLGY